MRKPMHMVAAEKQALGGLVHRKVPLAAQPQLKKFASRSELERESEFLPEGSRAELKVMKQTVNMHVRPCIVCRMLLALLFLGIPARICCSHLAFILYLHCSNVPGPQC